MHSGNSPSIEINKVPARHILFCAQAMHRSQAGTRPRLPTHRLMVGNSAHAPTHAL